MYLLNSFSLQMLEFPASVKFKEITKKEFIKKRDDKALLSAVGHADTAEILGFELNRINVKLKTGDEFLVAQLQGGRLPEGSKTLPEGFEFKFIMGKIE